MNKSISFPEYLFFLFKEIQEITVFYTQAVYAGRYAFSINKGNNPQPLLHTKIIEKHEIRNEVYLVCLADKKAVLEKVHYNTITEAQTGKQLIPGIPASPFLIAPG